MGVEIQNFERELEHILCISSRLFAQSAYSSKQRFSTIFSFQIKRAFPKRWQKVEAFSFNFSSELGPPQQNADGIDKLRKFCDTTSK